MADLFRPMQRKDYTTSLSGLVTKGMEKLETDMDNILRNKLSALQFSTPNLQYGRMIDQFMNEYRKKVIAWYETGKNHEDFRDAMNYKRNLRYNQILDIKKTEKYRKKCCSGHGKLELLSRKNKRFFSKNRFCYSALTSIF